MQRVVNDALLSQKFITVLLYFYLSTTYNRHGFELSRNKIPDLMPTMGSEYLTIKWKCLNISAKPT